MAPTMRASRSMQNQSHDASQNGSLAQRTKHAQKQNAKKAKKPKASGVSAAAAAKKPRVGFLELPPEIRNRIYQFAAEEDFVKTPDRAPPLFRRCVCPMHGPKPQWPMMRNQATARNFFGLTQVCKQIRSEFQPLWMRDACIRIKIQQLRSFMCCFYPNVSDYQNAPKLLQISWNHYSDCDPDQQINIIPLLQVRAHCPRFKAQFVVHDIVSHEYPDFEDAEFFFDFGCEECEDYLDSRGLDPDDSEYYEGIADCPHRIERQKEAWLEYMLEEEYAYLPSLNELLSLSNDKWLDHIRQNRITRVSIVTGSIMENEVHIRLSRKTAGLPKGRVTMVGLADQFLRSVDILNKDGMLDFYVTVEGRNFGDP